MCKCIGCAICNGFRTNTIYQHTITSCRVLIFLHINQENTLFFVSKEQLTFPTVVAAIFNSSTCYGWDVGTKLSKNSNKSLAIVIICSIIIKHSALYLLN